MPGPGRRLFVIAALAALVVGLAGCKSAEEKASDRAMPAVEKLCAAIPSVDAKEFVRASPGYADKLAALEEETATAPHPPAGTAAALKLAPAMAWIAAARAENTALEATFQASLGSIEHDAHEALASAVLGGPTKAAGDLGAAIAGSAVRPILLWHGSGERRGFDDDQQLLPYPERRAVDASARFIVAYVERVNGEGMSFAQEGVVAERKVAFVALFEMPSKRRMGVYAVKGETARLPKPLPLPGTTLPGEKPPLLESLLPHP